MCVCYREVVKLKADWLADWLTDWLMPLNKLPPD